MIGAVTGAGLVIAPSDSSTVSTGVRFFTVVFMMTGGTIGLGIFIIFG